MTVMNYMHARSGRAGRAWLQAGSLSHTLVVTGLLALCLAGLSVVNAAPSFQAALLFMLSVCYRFLRRSDDLDITVVLLCAFGLVPFVRADFRVISEAALLASVLTSVQTSRNGLLIRGLRWLREYRLPLILLTTAWFIALVNGAFVKHYRFAWDDARRYLGLLAIIPLARIAAAGRCNPAMLAKSIGLLASALLTLQLVTGIQVLQSAQGYMEGGVGGAFESVARGSAQGGNYLIVLLLFSSLAQLANRRGSSLLLMAQIGLATIGVIATFSRGIWAGVLIALLLFPFLSPKILRSTRVLLALPVLVIAIVFVAASFLPQQSAAVLHRITSIADEGEAGTSLGARLEENPQAVRAIIEHPFFGLGHGGEYKGTADQVERGFINESTFVHNGYLWIPLKLGVVGVFGFLLLVWRLLQAARSVARSPFGDIRALGQAAVCTLVVVLVNAVTSPVWAQHTDLVALSVLLIVVSFYKARASTEFSYAL